jgi:rare lipoprotein A
MLTAVPPRTPDICNAKFLLSHLTKFCEGLKMEERMKYPVLNLVLLFLLVLGCKPISGGNLPSATTPEAPHRQESPASDPGFSCLVQSHGEIWMKPYEINGRFFDPIADCTGFVQKGIASWYGVGFHGKKTSNGEIYDMNALSAAHKTLPLGIHIRVTNLNNGKKLILRINDRGPYAKNRVLDLSRAAALELGYHETGTAPVLIEALGYPAEQPSPRETDRKNPLQPGAISPSPFNSAGVLSGSGPQAGEYHPHQVEAKYFVQVGAFENQASAASLLYRVRLRFPSAVMEKNASRDQAVYCVRLKHFPSRQEAEKARLKLADWGFPDCLIVLEGFTKKT